MLSVPIIVIIVGSILQLLVCHISLWWLIAIVGRILFSLRMVGAVLKIKTTLTCEVAAVIAKILWSITFGSNSFEWKNFILFIAFSLICVLAEMFDEMMYVYITDEDEDYNAVDFADLTVAEEVATDEPVRKKRKKNVSSKGNNKGKGNKRNRPVKGKGRGRNRRNN